MASSPLPPIFELTVRVPGTSSKVADSVSGGDGLASGNARHILLLVHGYNNSQADAEESYGVFVNNIWQALDDSRAAPDAIAKFYWPGDESTVLGTTVGYPLDIPHARDAAARLVTFLVGLPNTGAVSRRITMVGHSMGCRLLLEALGKLPNAPGIEIVGLMAAASPIDFVKRGRRLFKTGNPPRRVLKFFSEQDLVLQVGFPLGQWLAFQEQIEDDNYSEAIGRHGHPGEFGIPQQTRNGHGDYWSDTKIVSTLVKQIDATQPQPLATVILPGRDLPPATLLAARSLPVHKAPFESV